jgi:hypothetical protein
MESSSSSNIQTPLDLLKSNFLTGYTTAAVLTALTYPISTTKARIQIFDSNITSLENLRKAIYLNTPNLSFSNKISSLYRGSIAGLSKKILSRSLFFSGQRVIADTLNKHHNEPSVFTEAIAGSLAGSLDTLLFYPLSYLKTRRQLLPQDSRSITSIVKADGIRTVYNGCALTLMQSFPSAFALFGGNQLLLSYFGAKHPGDASYPLLIAGSVTGTVLSTLISNPLDVIINHSIKSIPPVPAAQITKNIFNTQGLRGFTRGLGTNLVVSLPKKAFVFTLFNSIINGRRENEIEEIKTESMVKRID